MTENTITPEPTPASAQTSPIAEADPRSLDELMSRDPKLNTRQDRNIIVAEFRRMRAVWEKAKAEGKTKAPKEPKTKTTTSLEDLGL